jgi:cytochrome c553
MSMLRILPFLRAVCAAAALTAAVSVHAAVAIAPAPFANGNPELGKSLNDKSCVDCHARRFDGNPDRIYLRGERKVRTPAQLLAQVSYCSAEIGAGYFPDEEEHIAAYLNKQYYRFE